MDSLRPAFKASNPDEPYLAARNLRWIWIFTTNHTSTLQGKLEGQECLSNA